MRNVALATLMLLVGCSQAQSFKPQAGDIIFHTSRSAQSSAIQLATGSPYSHMGMIFWEDGSPLVFEAVEPVKATPLDQWIARGEGRHYVVKRLIDSDEILTDEALARMLAVGRQFAGRSYDLTFEWSDEKIYCSELVWKIYHRALALEVGELETMADFDLSAPAVRAKLRERWGDDLPLDEKVISPVAVFESPLLKEIYRN